MQISCVTLTIPPGQVVCGNTDKRTLRGRFRFSFHPPEISIAPRLKPGPSRTRETAIGPPFLLVSSTLRRNARTRTSFVRRSWLLDEIDERWAMKIVVLNGSPKGLVSVTMQYVLWLQKRFPTHEFTILDVCHDLKRLEDDERAFGDVLGEIEAADGVLWAFPLYYLLVHAHYKRFIELLFERGARAAFDGKYAAILTTSIKFFDHTAHAYVHGIADDLGMTFVGSYSAKMYDLLEAPERDRLALFVEGFLQAIEDGAAFPRQFPPVIPREFHYEPGAPAPGPTWPARKSWCSPMPKTRPAIWPG